MPHIYYQIYIIHFNITVINKIVEIIETFIFPDLYIGVARKSMEWDAICVNIIIAEDCVPTARSRAHFAWVRVLVLQIAGQR